MGWGTRTDSLGCPDNGHGNEQAGNRKTDLLSTIEYRALVQSKMRKTLE
jgi:hypothetical protein